MRYSSPAHSLQHSPNKALELYSNIALFFIFAVIVATLPALAHAAYINPSFDPTSGPTTPSPAVNDPITEIFGKIVYTMAGPTGRIICTLAVLVAGVGALFGRVSWIQALTISAGVGLVLSSTVFMNSIVGSNQGKMVPYSCGTIWEPTCIMLRNIVNAISSEAAAGIGCLCVVALGLAALFGKITLPQAVLVALGIGLIFGAASIIDLLWIPVGAHCNIIVGSMEFILCRFLYKLQSGAGQALATLTVMIMGILAMLGRISWQLGLTMMVGIALVCGADKIMGIIAPYAVVGACDTITLPVAFSSGPIETVLCQILALIYGSTGRALACSAIVMLGYGAMLGKISFGSAFVVAVGIAIAFGAPEIVNIMNPLMIPVCFSAGSLTVPSGLVPNIPYVCD